MRELRFHLLREQPRVTYWLPPGRVILLTVFRKTRGAETAELARADLRNRSTAGLARYSTGR